MIKYGDNIMPEEKKERIKFITLIAIISFFFSALGSVAANAFMGGRYAEKVEQTEKRVTVLENGLEYHKAYDNDTYVRKEVFEESVKRRDEMFKLILEKLDRIESKILR